MAQCSPALGMLLPSRARSAWVLVVPNSMSSPTSLQKNVPGSQALPSHPIHFSDPEVYGATLRPVLFLPHTRP